VLDLILRGGRVIDPLNSIDGVMDVGFAAGKVWGIAARIDDQAKEIRDVTGTIVTPVAEAFGIGPGEAGLGGGRIRGCCLSLPTAAQQAEGARRPGSENLAELQAALNEARGLDRSGKESDCMDAVQRAKRLAG
jgi:hypothetical protein